MCLEGPRFDSQNSQGCHISCIPSLWPYAPGFYSVTNLVPLWSLSLCSLVVLQLYPHGPFHTVWFAGPRMVVSLSSSSSCLSATPAPDSCSPVVTIVTAFYFHGWSLYNQEKQGSSPHVTSEEARTECLPLVRPLSRQTSQLDPKASCDADGWRQTDPLCRT